MKRNYLYLHFSPSNIPKIIFSLTGVKVSRFIGIMINVYKSQSSIVKHHFDELLKENVFSDEGHIERYHREREKDKLTPYKHFLFNSYGGETHTSWVTIVVFDSSGLKDEGWSNGLIPEYHWTWIRLFSVGAINF